jgi:hypothetical protein
MSYKTHAYLKVEATPERIKALLRELRPYTCKVEVHYGAKRLDLELDERLERWILIGGLARLLVNFEDILMWQPNFTQDDSLTPKRLYPNYKQPPH